MHDIGGSILFNGAATGDILILDEPLSFWGGVDHSSGEIVDVHHPQRGACVLGKVLVMTSGRGSSSSSSVFAELVRREIAPSAVIMVELDTILVLGAIVGDLLYDRRVPFVVIDREALQLLENGQQAVVDDNGLRVNS